MSSIADRFTYHEIDEEQSDKMELVREKFIELAELIERECPISREKSLAITELEKASFWANASIARY